MLEILFIQEPAATTASIALLGKHLIHSKKSLFQKLFIHFRSISKNSSPKSSVGGSMEEDYSRTSRGDIRKTFLECNDLLL